MNTGMECGENVKARATTRFHWWTLPVTRDAAEAALLPSRSRKPGTSTGHRLAFQTGQGTKGKVCWLRRAATVRGPSPDSERPSLGAASRYFAGRGGQPPGSVARQRGTGAELCARRPQRVGSLQGVPALDTPPTLRAVADLDVETAHQRAHRGKVFLILRRRAGHFDRAAAVRTGRRGRRRQGLVDPRRTRAAPLPAIARTGPPSGTAAATLRPVLGERRGLPASGPALRSQLLLQVLVLAPQALVLTLQAVVPAMHVLVARQVVAQSPDLPVLLLDDNVPRVLLGRGSVQDGEYAVRQAHAHLLSARRIKTITRTRGFLAGTR